MSEGQTEITAEVITEEIIVSAELKNIIEALIFASDEPMTVRFIRSIMDDVNKDLPPSEHLLINAEIVRKAVSDLNRGYGRMGSGFRIIEIGGGFTFATQEQFSSWVGKLAKERARRRLSPTAVETLAIIAYKQPIAKGEVEFIRGVNVDYIVNALLEKDLIHITGRASTPGRPLLYGTTQKFLEHFGLNEITDLPKPREISELINETEIEVDRRLLAEQQELEFKQDLENKLEGNEGSKNKPQKPVKVKVPDEIKTEHIQMVKHNGSTGLSAAPMEEKNIEKGEISSENNLATDETTAATEAVPSNGAAIPANVPEIRVTNAQDRLATEDQESRDRSSDHLPASPGISSTNLKNSGQQEKVLNENVPDHPAVNKKDHLSTDDLQHQKNDSENRETDLQSRVHQPDENAQIISTEDEAGRLEMSNENELQGRTNSEQNASGAETGWSKWKNKVKTFFQKLFA